MLRPGDAACTRDSNVDLTEAVGPGAGVSRLSSSAEGVVGVFETAQVGGLTASVCSMARPASCMPVMEDTWRL